LPLAFKKESFTEFLALLADATLNMAAAIVIMDNCSIYHAKMVKDLMNERNIKAVWNVPYCPQYNGIELYWAQTKRNFRNHVSQIKEGTARA
jgi:transposase